MTDLRGTPTPDPGHDGAASGPRHTLVGFWLTGEPGPERWSRLPLGQPEDELILVGPTRLPLAAQTLKARVVALPAGADLGLARRLGAAAATGDVIRFLDFGPDDSLGSTDRPRLSVIVPAGGDTSGLVEALAALASSSLPRSSWELIVVDDCSGASVADQAAPFADVIVRLTGRPNGPAYARNRGVEVASGDIVVFVDADIRVHRDTLELFSEAFLADPGVAAVFGSHDGNPPDGGVVTRYCDLMTLFRHRAIVGDTDRFWADCGAIRREVFLAVGGYDEWFFSRPQIEALELGWRLRSKGHRIVIRPDIQVTHLKRWTLGGWIRAEVTDRAVPSNRLWGSPGRLARRHPWRSDRVGSALAWLATLSGAVWVVGGGGTPAAFVALGAALALLLIDLEIYWFIGGRSGILLAVQAVPLHFLHHLAWGVGSAFGRLLRHSIGEPQPSPAVQALSEVGVRTWPPVPRRANEPRLGAASSAERRL